MDEEDEDNEDGLVEDSHDAMNERAHRYFPELPMEIE